MNRILIPCMAVMVLCAQLLAGTASGAEATKLVYAASLYADEKGVGLSRPDGTGCAGGNVLVVADTGNGRLLSYVYQQSIFRFTGEVKLPELTAPSKVQINSKGEILAFDEKQRRIVRVSREGALLGIVAPTGMPVNASAMTPRSFALDAGDRLYVLDIAADRIVVLDPSGAFVRAIAYPADHGFLSDVAVDSSGTVYAVDPVQARVFSAAPTAPALTPLSPPLREQVRFPSSIAVDEKDWLWVVDRNGGTLAVLDRSGSLQAKYLDHGWKDGQLRYPSQACITPPGTLFIADRENNRVQVFTVVR